MNIALKEIAEKTGGVLEGDGAIEITGLASLTESVPGSISFLTKAKYASEVATTKASAIIVATGWEGQAPCAVIRVDDPDRAFVIVAEAFAPEPPASDAGIDASAVVDATAQVDPSAHIGPLCVVESGATIGKNSILVAGCFVGTDASIGDGCLLYANVSVRERVIIGNRAIIHCGAVIGSDGFGYVKEGDVWKKVPQIGIVEMGDDVEIGANVAIDRARFGRTLIEDGVKIDNLVQIAHNVHVGANTAMAAQVGIAGSSVIGPNVQMGGKAGVGGHVKIGAYSVIGGGSGVTTDIPEKSYVSGLPARPHRDTMRMHVNMLRVPALKKKIAELEQKMKALEDATGGGDA